MYYHEEVHFSNKSSADHFSTLACVEKSVSSCMNNDEVIFSELNFKDYQGKCITCGS